MSFLFNLVYETLLHICYRSTCLRGVAQIWRDEFLPSVRMLRGGKPAPAFPSSVHSKTL